jgi:hypothetical protein
MAKMNGFDKLVFFNNSLSKEYDYLAAKYAGFLHIVQFQCIPNFFPNQTKQFLSFNEIEILNRKEAFYIHVHFEFITQNECFLTNIDKYEPIAILDQDEMILQRRMIRFKIIDSSLIAGKDFEEECSTQDKNIKDYLTELKRDISDRKKRSRLPKRTIYSIILFQNGSLFRLSTS